MNGAAGAVGGFSLGVPLAGVESAVKLSGEECVDCSDADFGLVIKRMAKKDSTTKLKVRRHADNSSCGNSDAVLSLITCGLSSSLCENDLTDSVFLLSCCVEVIVSKNMTLR